MPSTIKHIPRHIKKIKKLNPKMTLNVLLLEEDAEKNYLLEIKVQNKSDCVLISEPEWENYENLFNKRAMRRIEKVIQSIA